MLDTTISGGVIADGTGAARYAADIGIRDGLIVEIGRVTTPARRRIDADGALVTPGFIDMHTHYDAQATWDPELLASSRNGVTTAVMGNCGVGCAPCRPGDEAVLVDLLAGVEDIPVPVLNVAMDWRWETFGEYLSVLEQTPRAIDVGAYVSHGAARLRALGRRALDQAPASDEDIRAVREAVREALDAGALGLSTGRIHSHHMASGRLTPDYAAPDAEVLALAEAVGATPGRVLQFATDFHQHLGGDAAGADLALLSKIARLNPGAVSVALHEWPRLSGGWRAIDAALRRIDALGHPLTREVTTRAIGMMIGLGLTIHPFARHPSFQPLKDLPAARRAAALRDPALRARLLSERPVEAADDLDFRHIAALEANAGRIFVCDGAPDYEPDASMSVLATSRRFGKPVMEIYYDALIAQGGEGLLYYPFFNFDADALEGVRERLTLPNAIISFGDAGAHSAMICDSAYSTFSLTHWTRDRRAGGRLPLEQVVEMMTGRQAAHFGLKDRGRIALGARADLNVIDYERLACAAPRLVADLPGGGRRLLQLAQGYLTTMVAGETIVQDDVLTGERPGKVLRAGRVN
jgi:N-acyl-D-aspartate/D-glutamate deacylase